MPFLLPDTVQLESLGGKGAALARLSALDFEIPEWFAVTADQTWTAAELEFALLNLGGGSFAVRSSATMEDGVDHSFAGQFSSFLEVSPSEIETKIFKVRASARMDSVLTYCQERGLTAPPSPTVLVQRMIAPRCAGVAFSADPISGQRGLAVVSAVAGTSEKLVSGEVDGQTWRVTRARKVSSAEANSLLATTEVIAIEELVRRCEMAFGLPQDIEWAIDHTGKLWLLQSRPITTLRLIPDPDDTLRVWDNSNIAESYCGVTTPLTFSFARRIYESAYREFCNLMSVPKARITRTDDVFQQMLGLIRGRVYYNLVSWYRVLALLPGFQINRSFMQQMMGLREPLPAEIVQKIIAENGGSRLTDGWALARSVCGLMRQYWGLPRQIQHFKNRLDKALAKPVVALAEMSGEELVAHYRELERQLLKKWDAPLVNDFFAMIFYGILRNISKKWQGDTSGTLQNKCLLDDHEIISAEPPRRIIKMAALAAKDPELTKILKDSKIPVRQKWVAIRCNPGLAAALESYLNDFGDRCLEELKLESSTVRDDPANLFISIGAMATRPTTEERSPVVEKDHSYGLIPIKRMVFSWVVRQTRVRVRTRENLRFERTRLFGRVRSIFRELGKRLNADGLLEASDDIFYLEISEVLAAWEATGTTHDFAALVRQRRAEFHHFSTGVEPPDRFETRGPLNRYENFEASQPQALTEAALSGNGACPGRVTGKVRVVLDPRNACLEAGEILVARQTDPGWVVLFPAAAGLLVERGSLLSHSAIVARELRLPCIVSLPGITSILKTGDLIEMDGALGTIRMIEAS
jgi:rifampicin phosphotransferase